MKTIKLDPCAGSRIDNVVKDAVQTAKRERAIVRFRFNGMSLFATPKKSPFTLLWEWETELDRIHHLPRVVAARRQRENHQEQETIRLQHELDLMLNVFNEASANLDSLIKWFQKFTPLSDWISVKFNAPDLLAKLVAAGYTENRHVGQPPEFFNQRQVMGEYIIGQVMNCLSKGMPPHPVTASFCERYFALPPMETEQPTAVPLN